MSIKFKHWWKENGGLLVLIAIGGLFIGFSSLVAYVDNSVTQAESDQRIMQVQVYKKLKRQPYIKKETGVKLLNGAVKLKNKNLLKRMNNQVLVNNKNGQELLITVPSKHNDYYLVKNVNDRFVVINPTWQRTHHSD